jgi:hypothetical protein
VESLAQESATHSHSSCAFSSSCSYCQLGLTYGKGLHTPIHDTLMGPSSSTLKPRGYTSLREILHILLPTFYKLFLTNSKVVNTISLCSEQVGPQKLRAHSPPIAGPPGRGPEREQAAADQRLLRPADCPNAEAVLLVSCQKRHHLRRAYSLIA